MGTNELILFLIVRKEGGLEAHLLKQFGLARWVLPMRKLDQVTIPANARGLDVVP